MARKKNKTVDGVEISGGNRASAPDEWETKNHLEKILDAHEIMADPEKMKHIKKLAKKRKKAFTSIEQVKEYAQDKYGGVGGKPKEDADE